MRKRFMEGFHYDAHPMGMLVSGVAALSTFYLDAKDIDDPDVRHKQIVRLIAKMPTIAACSYRLQRGHAVRLARQLQDFTANFLRMMFEPWEHVKWQDPVLAKALDVLFILHADHEQNCSTTAMRVVGSSHADPFTGTAAAAPPLYGPRHGGANEPVIHMLTEIGSVENVDAFVKSVKEGTGGRLQGFGHRVYKNYDPRAKIIKQTADEVFAVTGKNPLLDIALKLEEVALLRRLLHQPQALPERRLLLGAHLPGDGLPGRNLGPAWSAGPCGLPRHLATGGPDRFWWAAAASAQLHRHRRSPHPLHHPGAGAASRADRAGPADRGSRSSSPTRRSSSPRWGPPSGKQITGIRWARPTTPRSTRACCAGRWARAS